MFNRFFGIVCAAFALALGAFMGASITTSAHATTQVVPTTERTIEPYALPDHEDVVEILSSISGAPAGLASEILGDIDPLPGQEQFPCEYLWEHLNEVDNRIEDCIAAGPAECPEYMRLAMERERLEIIAMMNQKNCPGAPPYPYGY
jgi:hypothetical protein